MRGSSSSLAAMVATLALATTATAAEPDAAALVRQVRKREAWIEHVDSLQIKAVQDWERTPKGIERQRRRLEKQIPGSPSESDPNSRPHCKWIIEQAYDRTRLRLRVQDEGYSDDLRVWDGKRCFSQNRYSEWPGLRADQDGTLIAKDPASMSWLLWTNFACFRAGPHVFWWNSPKERPEIERMAPKPEDFAYEGQVDFYGIKCHVVSHWDSWTSLFIGVDDGRLHGIRSGAQTTTKIKQSIIALLREAGRQIKDEQDLERQSASLTAAERARMARLGAGRMTQLIDPVLRVPAGSEQGDRTRLPAAADPVDPVLRGRRQWAGVRDRELGTPHPRGQGEQTSPRFPLHRGLQGGRADQRPDGRPAAIVSLQGEVHGRRVVSNPRRGEQEGREVRPTAIQRP